MTHLFRRQGLVDTVLPIPDGGSYDKYDRHAVTMAGLGLDKLFPKTMEADRAVVAVELGISEFNGFPDLSVMRNGRGPTFGAVPYRSSTGALTACKETAPGLNGKPGTTCTRDGFVNSIAEGRNRLLPSWHLFRMWPLAMRTALRADWGMVLCRNWVYRIWRGQLQLAS